jgi:hypothetical protein
MIRILLCVLLLSVAGQAQAQQYNERIISRSLEGKSYYAEVNFRVKDHQILIPVTVGNDTLWFVFDTAALTVVKKSVAERYGWAGEGDIALIDAHEAEADYQMVQVPVLEIAGLVLSDAPAVLVEDDNFLFACFPIDGILGSNLFVGARVTIDYAGRKLTIEHSQEEPLSHALHTDPQNIPHLLIPIAGKEEPFVLDSGNMSFGMITKGTFRKLRDRFDYSWQKMGISSWSLNGYADIDVTTHQVTNRFPLTPDEEVYMKFRPGAENVLGVRLLEQGVLTLDFGSRSWAFECYADYAPEEVRRLNVMLGRLDREVIVIWMDRSVKSIRPGDTVLSIGDLELDALTVCASLNWEMTDEMLGRPARIQTTRGVEEVVVRYL